MLKIYADYHTHTKYSDGVGTIEENVLEAINKGLKEVAISDHAFAHLHHGLKREKIQEIREEIDRLKEKYKDRIKIFLSVEANILSLNGDIDVKDEDRRYFDIVSLGYHRFVKYSSIKDWFHFMIRSKFGGKKTLKLSTDSFIKAVSKHNIDFITHPDDPLRVNLIPLAIECQKNNTAFEINCKHKNLDENMIKELKDTNVKFIIGTDAHKPINVGNFEYAYELLSRIENKENIVNIEKEIQED